MDPTTLCHFKELELARILCDPGQPRKVFREETVRKLAQSIEQEGLVQPLVVKPNQDPSNPDTYVLVAGERRLRALLSLGRKTEYCKVIAGNANTFALSLVENLHREDLNFIDQAESLQKLHDQGMTFEAIEKFTGIDVVTIYNRMALLKLPLEVQELVRSGKLNQQSSLNLSQFKGSHGQLLKLAHRLIAGEVPVEVLSASFTPSALSERNVGCHIPTEPTKMLKRILELTWRARSFLPAAARFIALEPSARVPLLKGLAAPARRNLLSQMDALVRVCDQFAELVRKEAPLLGEEIEEVPARKQAKPLAERKLRKKVEKATPASNGHMPLAPSPTAAAEPARPVIARKPAPVQPPVFCFKHDPRGGKLPEDDKLMKHLTFLLEYVFQPEEIVLSRSHLAARFPEAKDRIDADVCELLRLMCENWHRPPNGEDRLRREFLFSVNRLRHDSGCHNFGAMLKLLLAQNTCRDKVSLSRFIAKFQSQPAHS